MKEKNKGLAVFLLSFCITIMALGIILFIIAVILNIKSETSVSSTPKYITKESLNSKNSLSVTVIGCEKAESPPQFILYLHFNAVTGKITLFELPPTTVVEADGREDTLSGHYEYKGATGLTSAVAVLLSSDTSMYIRMQKDDITNMCDFLGGAVCSVSDETAEKYSIKSGTWRLDGAMISKLLLSEDTDFELKKKILSVLCGDELIKALSEKFSLLVDSVFDNSVTNLSRYDLTVRRNAVETLAYNKSLSYEVIKLAGSYSSDMSEYYADSKSITDIKKAIS